MNQKTAITKALEPYMVDGTHSIKTILALLFSGVVSTFGAYTLASPSFDKTQTLVLALVMFVAILVAFDSVKRGTFTKYANSLLKKKILGTKSKKLYLVVAITSFLFMLMLNGIGSWTTATVVNSLYVQQNADSSTEFKILEQNAQNGKAVVNNYALELSAWKESKAKAYKNCDDTWKGWKAKYPAKCKTSWDNAKDKNGNLIHAMPTQKGNANIDIEEYKSIKGNFLNDYLFMIVFLILFIGNAIMEYMTLAKIHDDYIEKSESLTDIKIDLINDHIDELQTIENEHEKEKSEVVTTSERKQKAEKIRFMKTGEGIKLALVRKDTETRGHTLKRIANNTQFTENEPSVKAAFVDTSSSSNDVDEEVKKKVDETASEPKKKVNTKPKKSWGGKLKKAKLSNADKRANNLLKLEAKARAEAKRAKEQEQKDRNIAELKRSVSTIDPIEILRERFKGVNKIGDPLISVKNLNLPKGKALNILTNELNVHLLEAKLVTKNGNFYYSNAPFEKILNYIKEIYK